MDEADDPGLVEWLAAATGATPDEVADDLRAGEHRRAFVTAELVEAGYRGSELVDRVVRLTGVDEAEARKLIAAHVG